MNPAVARVLDEFHRFNTPAARAAFAGNWIKVVAVKLEHTWPCVYELLVLIRDQELYKRKGFLDDAQAFPTFEAFFEEVMGKPSTASASSAGPGPRAASAASRPGAASSSSRRGRARRVRAAARPWRA
jgi:hypothetical protein